MKVALKKVTSYLCSMRLTDFLGSCKEVFAVTNSNRDG